MFLDRWRRVASSRLDRHRTTYLSPRGNPKTFRSASNLKLQMHQTAAIVRNLVMYVERSGSEDLHRTARKACGRTPRSRPNRTAIAARSSRDRSSFSVTICPRDRRVIDGLPGLRSRPDRGRSWPDRGPIVGLLEAKIADILKRNRSKIEADSKPIRKLRLHGMKPPPRRMDSAPRPAPSPTISSQFLL